MNSYGHNQAIPELQKYEKFWNETAAKADAKQLVTANHVAVRFARCERAKIKWHKAQARKRRNENAKPKVKNQSAYILSGR